MTSRFPSYRGCRFPPEISHAIWLYHRFCLSSRDAEDLLAQRGLSSVHATDQYANSRADVSHHNRPVSAASVRCNASSRPPPCNVWCPCTASCRTFSGWADICCGWLTTGCYERRRFTSDMRRRTPAKG